MTDTVASDPIKLAALRIAERHRTAALQQQPALADDRRFWEFSRLLVKLPEHTWGVDVASFLDGITATQSVLCY